MKKIARILAETLSGRPSAADGDYGDQVMSAGWNPALEQLRTATDDPEATRDYKPG